MIYMVHFANETSLLPLLRQYGVNNPRDWREWQGKPRWLIKMWDVSKREWQRSKKLPWLKRKRKNGRLQHWQHYHSGKQRVTSGDAAL